MLTINIKHICKSKKVIASKFFLIALLSLVATTKANAAENPVEKIVNFYKGKLEEARENKKEKQNIVEVENQPTIKNEKKTDNKKEASKKKIPQVVDDPLEIEKAAEFAAQKTGVRKDFLMGMLVVESNLGRNYGQCSYDEVASGAEQSYEDGRLSGRAWRTFKQRQDTIINIADDLGYDYHNIKVSCNPTNYAGTGGAMGIAQFMPDIWMAYEKEIAEIVGKKNPDPWNTKDGVVAMALLLADTPGVTEHNLYAERNAAKMYLSGTTSSQYEWYANQIIYWSQNYKTLLG